VSSVVCVCTRVRVYSSACVGVFLFQTIAISHALFPALLADLFPPCFRQREMEWKKDEEKKKVSICV